MNRCTDYNKKGHFIHKLFQEEDQNNPVLYHLDESMRDYITILTRRMKHAIARDLSEMYDVKITASSGLENIVLSEINNESIEYDD